MSSATIFYLVMLAGGISGYSTHGGNLSCYQCTRKTREACPPQTLLPCPSSKDRCVTHISKDSTNGFSMKKECGLGPCGFEDDMVNRGLGLDKCDTSKDEFFCVFCCRTSGCNGAQRTCTVHGSLISLSIIFVLASLARKFKI